MAKVTFEVGDLFFVPATNVKPGFFGVVLSDDRAVTISGEGGRVGYSVACGPLPQDAIPLDDRLAHTIYMKFEVKFALDTVRIALTGR